MNMMSVLLGATGLLLVAALILSFGSMNSGVKEEPSQAEISALRNEVKVLQDAENELRFLRHQKTSGGPTLAIPTAAASSVATAAAAMEEANNKSILAAQNALLKEELAEAQSEADKQEKMAKVSSAEAKLAWEDKIESSDRNVRQANIIKEALLIATVTEWSPEDGFAVLNVHRHESAQEGTTLAIRRNTGIIGQLKVSSLYNDGAVADPIAATFLGGSLDIRAGDELILPPL